jgi:hypothetical protein
VTKKIEVDPVFGFTADLAANDIAVEMTSRLLVVDRERHVEGDHADGLLLICSITTAPYAAVTPEKLSSWREPASRIKIAIP